MKKKKNMFVVEDYDALEGLLENIKKMYCKTCEYKTLHFRRGYEDEDGNTWYSCLKCEERGEDNVEI